MTNTYIVIVLSVRASVKSDAVTTACVQYSKGVDAGRPVTHVLVRVTVNKLRPTSETLSSVSARRSLLRVPFLLLFLSGRLGDKMSELA